MLYPARTELRRSKYRLLGLVGQGQFGQVFCALHRPTGQLVALKNLEQDRFPTHKFLRELRFLLSLQHPNIVTCRALEHTATGRYLVMDYCEGGTLRGLMVEESRLSLPYAAKLIEDMLAGLDHAHSRGIVHCDIKPENILVQLDPAGWMARISDFGIARLRQDSQIWDGATGSPAYMAPERFYGQYSAASDLYSVGILLFELITGYRPFSGTPAELMSAHLNQPLQLPENLPLIWQPVIAKALQKLPGRRFRSAAEMLEAVRLARVADSPTTQAPPPLFSTVLAPPHCRFEPTRQQPLQRQIHRLATPQANLTQDRSSDRSGGATNTQLWQATASASMMVKGGEWIEMLALDSRHLALFWNCSQNAGTVISLLTRRGQDLGAFILPMQLRQVSLTARPYRLLATDDRTGTVILLDLKPYRIRRLWVEISPQFLLAADWGYILAEASGRMVFLDQTGRPIGQLKAPSQITALALWQNQLWLATWDGGQGMLYGLDLHHLGLDLVF